MSIHRGPESKANLCVTQRAILFLCGETVLTKNRNSKLRSSLEVYFSWVQGTNQVGWCAIENVNNVKDSIMYNVRGSLGTLGVLRLESLDSVFEKINESFFNCGER